MGDLPVKPEQPKDPNAVEIHQGNVGILTVKLLNECARELRRINENLEKLHQS